MSFTTNPARFWYVFNNRLALVEKNGTTTTDGASTVYKSITAAKPLVIHSISKADHFGKGAGIVHAEFGSSVEGPLGDIPIQFHEALVYKVIAMGYKTPPNINIELAQYFDMEYEKVVKNAKKYAKSAFIQTGVVNPVSF
tara:strand:- start:102 stop:521 length:420 start_codon:yes stop_codon:yes gene_type:complete